MKKLRTVVQQTAARVGMQKDRIRWLETSPNGRGEGDGRDDFVINRDESVFLKDGEDTVLTVKTLHDHFLIHFNYMMLFTPTK